MDRRCGVLLPVTSLPSRYGIGCFSKEAYEFVDFLADAGQTYWQILPLGQTGYGDSPYQSFSTFAGNPYFIDPEALIEAGYIDRSTVEQFDFGKEPRSVDYDKIYKLYVSVSEEEEDRLTLLDTLGHMRFVPDYVMFQPDEKKDGILRMLELTGGDPSAVVVFGDDTNDMVMFDPAFYCVAMGNGSEALKARADYIAAPNLDDGIYKACSEHGWF